MLNVSLVQSYRPNCIAIVKKLTKRAAVMPRQKEPMNAIEGNEIPSKAFQLFQGLSVEAQNAILAKIEAELVGQS